MMTLIYIITNLTFLQLLLASENMSEDYKNSKKWAIFSTNCILILIYILVLIFYIKWKAAILLPSIVIITFLTLKQKKETRKKLSKTLDKYFNKYFICLYYLFNTLLVISLILFLISILIKP